VFDHKAKTAGQADYFSGRLFQGVEQFFDMARLDVLEVAQPRCDSQPKQVPLEGRRQPGQLLPVQDHPSPLLAGHFGP